MLFFNRKRSQSTLPPPSPLPIAPPLAARSHTLPLPRSLSPSPPRLAINTSPSQDTQRYFCYFDTCFAAYCPVHQPRSPLTPGVVHISDTLPLSRTPSAASKGSKAYPKFRCYATVCEAVNCPQHGRGLSPSLSPSPSPSPSASPSPSPTLPSPSPTLASPPSLILHPAPHCRTPTTSPTSPSFSLTTLHPTPSITALINKSSATSKAARGRRRSDKENAPLGLGAGKEGKERRGAGGRRRGLVFSVVPEGMEMEGVDVGC